MDWLYPATQTPKAYGTKYHKHWKKHWKSGLQSTFKYKIMNSLIIPSYTINIHLMEKI